MYSLSFVLILGPMTDSDESDYTDEYVYLSDIDDKKTISLIEQHAEETYKEILRFSIKDDVNHYNLKLAFECQGIISHLTGQAWGIITESPVCINISGSVSDYPCKKFIISVHQFDKPLYQLDIVAKKFVRLLSRLGKEFPYEEAYYQNNEEGILLYLELGCTPEDAVILHSLYKEDVDNGIMLLTEKDTNLIDLLIDYLKYRLPTLARHCIHCDEIPFFVKQRNVSMLKPFVCGNPLCVFQYCKMNMGSEFASGSISSANLMYLLVKLSIIASKSKRKELLFNPFPTIVDPIDGAQLILDPEVPNYEILNEIMDALPTEEQSYTVSSKSLLMAEIDMIHPLASTLFNWITSSCLAHIVELPDPLQIEQLQTPKQYLYASDAPEKEVEFQRRKIEHGSIFAWHGTKLDCLHSITRRGLFNASGTKMQTTGAIHGKGIYLSPSYQTSLRYCGYSRGLTVIILCEVIDQDIKKHNGSIWTVTDPMDVCTRFLIVYDERNNSIKYNPTEPDNDSRLREIINYFN